MSQGMLAVTPNALVKRINRKLAPEGEVLKATRSERWRGELGDHYTVNEANYVSSKHVDLAQLARDLGVLKEGEAIA